jgi:hypothetical protein
MMMMIIMMITTTTIIIIIITNLGQELQCNNKINFGENVAKLRTR